MVKYCIIQWITCKQDEKWTYSSHFTVLGFVLVNVIWIRRILVASWTGKNGSAFSGTMTVFLSMVSNIKEVQSSKKWSLINACFVTMILNSKGPTTLVGGHNVHRVLYSLYSKYIESEKHCQIHTQKERTDISFS